MEKEINIDSEFKAWFDESGLDPLTRNELQFANALFNLPEMELIGAFNHIFESIRKWKRQNHK